MRGFKFNFITIFAFVLLVIYAYLAAMGILYQPKGVVPFADKLGLITIAGLFFIAVIAVVSLCIYFMCKARATRWDKIGIPGQIALGIVIVIVFIGISTPFSTYVTVLGRKTDIYKNVEQVVTAAKGLNTAYNEYVSQRIKAYHPTESTTHRNEIRVKTLSRSIYPVELQEKQLEREEWLNKIPNMKLSNVQMPNNLAIIDSCVNRWQQDYITLSSISFADEESVEPFEYPDFKAAYSVLSSQFKYSIWALIVAIICSIFMLMPYFTTETSMALRTHSGGVGKKIKKIFVASENDAKDEDLEYI